MQYRRLGKTGLQISALSFGAGPVSTLLVGDDQVRQRRVVRHALAAGVNWFDTAATYGAGQSELSLGRVIRQLDAAGQVHVATKVRLMPQDLGDITGAVRRCVQGSLVRLGLPRVTLLQLHNSVTRQRGDEPTSITPADVLGPAGVAETFRQLREEGLISHLGLTGIGQPEALCEVIGSGQFETLQVPYHLLNPSAGRTMPVGFAETDYGNIIADCQRQDMGVLAIRVLAGGALAGRPPSPHTLKTPFFPLALYERDRARADRLQALLGPNRRLSVAAVRFALAHRHVHSALVGFGDAGEIDEALEALQPDPSPIDWSSLLASLD